jgi:hypothetical protein
VEIAMKPGCAKRCREQAGVCATGGTVLSTHPTTDGLVSYVRCRCGGTRVVVAHWSASVPTVSGGRPVGVG